MTSVKNLLNPWIVILLIVVLLVGSLAYAYFGSCQSSKWHFIFQSYYCPDWINPDLDFDETKHDHWEEWFKNGQRKIYYDVDSSKSITFQMWEEAGQKRIHYFYDSIQKDYLRVSWALSGQKNKSASFDKYTKEWRYSEWFEDGRLKSEVNGARFFVKKINPAAKNYLKMRKPFEINSYGISTFHFKLLDAYFEIYAPEVNVREIKRNEWYQSDQIKRRLIYKKVIVRYAYKYISGKGKHKLTIDDQKKFKILWEYLNRYYFSTVVDIDFIEEDGDLMDGDLFDYYFNENVHTSYMQSVVSTFENNCLVFKVKLSDQKLYPYRHYSKGELEEMTRNSSEVLEVKVHFTFEGENEPAVTSEYPFRFECSYVEGSWVQYKENGDIDFIQTHNKKGRKVKIEIYKNNKPDKVYQAIENAIINQSID